MLFVKSVNVLKCDMVGLYDICDLNFKTVQRMNEVESKYILPSLKSVYFQNVSMHACST